MKVAIFLGPPGAGKGTQCALLSARLNVRHISTGAIIRREILSQSELGKKVQGVVEAGYLVDDNMVFSCLRSTLESLNPGNDDLVLLDGIPRNLTQAVMMDSFLQDFSAKVDCVICLEADMEKLVERFARRRTCTACGQVAAVEDSLMSSGDCPLCGAVKTLVIRKDDEPATVRHRFEVYKSETQPLVSFYQERKLLNTVSALNSTETVYAQIVSVLLRK